MRLAVDINHPGHVHFFKHLIWDMQEKGHQVLISSTCKEMAQTLLDGCGFGYLDMGKHYDSLFGKLLKMPVGNLKLFEAYREFKPDVAVAIAAIRASHAAWPKRIPCVSFDDTEHASMQIALYRPLSSSILTPECFTKYLGPKQIRYPGYHELAYLHPKRFKPDPGVLEKYGISRNEKYAVVRFVSWRASHDTIHSGLGPRDKLKVVKELEKHARPIITSEVDLPKKLEKYKMTLPPDVIHHALAGACLYVGDGGTMASEAAVLGVPSVYTNPLCMGYIADQKRYGLLHHPKADLRHTLAAVEDCLRTPQEEWKRRREKMLAGKIDVTGFMIWFLENYPQSKEILKDEPERMANFK